MTGTTMTSTLQKCITKANILDIYTAIQKIHFKTSQVDNNTLIQYDTKAAL